jgi:glycosyltransferase involved in cell wall biosynthesis
MPRILHLIETAGPGGAETVLIHLVEGLTARGWHSRVLVPRVDWLWEQLAERQLDCGLLESRGRFSSRLLLALIRGIRDFRPHLIHAHFLGSAVYGSIASSLSTGTPLVCTFHGTPDVDPYDRMLGLKARILSRSRNRVVYVSYHLRRHLEPILGVPHHLGAVIHNGIPLPDERVSEARPSLEGVGPGARLIGAVGNLRPAKDYPNLLRSAQLVCRAEPQAEFLIAGGGPKEVLRDLRTLQRTLGIEGKVHFLGFRSDVQSILAAVEVFVSSSETEGLPLASVEAMAMGKPVVLTNCGGVPEVVEDGRTGLLVPVKDPRALADGVLRLLGDRALAERLGQAGRTRVETAFSLRSMLDRYTELYEHLLALRMRAP